MPHKIKVFPEHPSRRTKEQKTTSSRQTPNPKPSKLSALTRHILHFFLFNLLFSLPTKTDEQINKPSTNEICASSRRNAHHTLHPRLRRLAARLRAISAYGTVLPISGGDSIRSRPQVLAYGDRWVAWFLYFFGEGELGYSHPFNWFVFPSFRHLPLTYSFKILKPFKQRTRSNSPPHPPPTKSNNFRNPQTPRNGCKH